MHTEAEALGIFQNFHPTMADYILCFLIVAMIILVIYSVNRMNRMIAENKKEYNAHIAENDGKIEANRQERQEQINEIKTLLVENVARIETSIEKHVEAMDKLTEKMTQSNMALEIHLARHEESAKEYMHLCEEVKDHEARLRPIEKAIERRGGDRG
jgi:hypothetical protein